MLSKVKTILIEDDSKKIEDIRDFLKNNLSCSNLVVKESYQSGIREILSNSYELLLLDMSIPTYDKTLYESGGSYEKFGGYKVLKEIIRKRKPLKTILITMFDDFGESDISVTLAQIDDTLKSEFNDFYLGYVFYHAADTQWQNDLKMIIENHIK